MRMLIPVLGAFLHVPMLSAVPAEGGPYVPGGVVTGDFKNFAQVFLEKHCFDCHDDATAKGDLSLIELGPVDETNAALWKSIWAQVSLQEMPPPKKAQPGLIERLRFSDWVVAELRMAMKNKGGFRAHLDPHKGNFLNHNLLFEPLPQGIELKPASSPARLWRVTPQEHITRLNDLINTEPEYDASHPGRRTHGDVVPTNHGGELKLYFGTDRITKWLGGTVAYATAVKSVPAVLSSTRKHGFENYPGFATVNSAEATQILAKAEDVLRYMAYGPLSIAQPEQITDDPNSYKMVGDIRGQPTSIVYNTKVVRPMTPMYDLMKEGGVTEKRLEEVVEFLFEAVTFRPPTPEETEAYVEIVRNAIEKVGKEEGVFMGLSSLFLDRDALFRPELARSGSPDTHGRVQLQDWELALAVNHSLRYIKPDGALRTAVAEGRMRTREDVKREVERMLADDSIRKPRLLRFFRDYFDYDLGGYICKDSRALAETGVSNRGTEHYRVMFDATASTDRVIELILQEDKEVLRSLLTTDRVVVTGKDAIYLGKRRSEAERKAAVEKDRKAFEESRKKAETVVKTLEREISTLQENSEKNPKDKGLERTLGQKRKELASAKKQADPKRKPRNRPNAGVETAKLSGPKIFARVSRRSFGAGSMTPERTLATLPASQRRGILTHSGWLVSHSDAMDNHAILRGRWIRERLLGGGIPDVPITVDAQLPDEPQSTLRERMRVTRQEYCWTCHRKMDPLGLPFEMYNHAGLYRTRELGKPVDTSGEIIDSGDPSLDGKVADALELIDRLAESERVEQVFVRHAFRFWMGRNETLNDAPVLQAAHHAYRGGGGSMKALLVSLLTSDAFLYRTVGALDSPEGSGSP